MNNTENINTTTGYELNWNNASAKYPEDNKRVLLKLKSLEYNSIQADSGTYNKNDGKYHSTVLDKYGSRYEVLAWANYE